MQEADPALHAFLGLLARDMAAHPERLQAMDAELARRMHGLTEGIDVDLDAPLAADDA